MVEALAALLRANLAAAAAILLILALRPAIRRLFGAGAAYGLWSLAPLAALGALLPARMLTPGDQPAAGAGTPGVQGIAAAVAGEGPAFQQTRRHRRLPQRLDHRGPDRQERRDDRQFGFGPTRPGPALTPLRPPAHGAPRP